VVRTNLAANDAAYNCVYEGEDEEGTRGVRLSKDLMAIAGARAGGGAEGRRALGRLGMRPGQGAGTA
jgi:hypothetical protein